MCGERIRSAYEKKCLQLQNQDVNGEETVSVFKMRMALRDLHSRLKVSIHSVESISKRIESLRDEELHPQLLELVQGEYIASEYALRGNLAGKADVYSYGVVSLEIVNGMSNISYKSMDEHIYLLDRWSTKKAVNSNVVVFVAAQSVMWSCQFLCSQI